jgi:hypothetical protein
MQLSNHWGLEGDHLLPCMWSCGLQDRQRLWFVCGDAVKRIREAIEAICTKMVAWWRTNICEVIPLFKTWSASDFCGVWARVPVSRDWPLCKAWDRLIWDAKKALIGWLSAVHERGFWYSQTSQTPKSLLLWEHEVCIGPLSLVNHCCGAKLGFGSPTQIANIDTPEHGNINASFFGFFVWKTLQCDGKRMKRSLYTMQKPFEKSLCKCWSFIVNRLCSINALSVVFDEAISFEKLWNAR